MNHCFAKALIVLAALALPVTARAYEAWRGPTGVLKHVPE